MVTIRTGKKEDLPQVLGLIRELALYERAPQEVTNTLEMMEEDGFGPESVFKFLVAERIEKIIGIALYYIKYSTWKGKCLFLEDLIVTENERGNGIGAMLFERIMLISKEMGAARMEWQVLDWNTPAINFYNKFGATLDPEWINGKFTSDQLKKYFSSKPVTAREQELERK